MVQIERIQEILEETQELRSHVGFAGRGWSALGKASANRLLDPDHIGQIDPGIGILDWLVGTILPQEWTIFLEEAFKRRAPRAPIEPNGYFVLSSFIVRWKVPEVQLAGLILM